MNRIHSTFIALLICAAATAGLYAAVQTVRLGQTPASPVSARELAGRQAKLDAWRHSLDVARAKRPPALPKLPHYPPVHSQPAPAPSVATAPPPPVTYVHAPTVVEYKHAPGPATTTSTTSWSDDDSSDDSSEDSGSDGGGD